MSSIVSFHQGLSVDLISTSQHARKSEIIEVHTPSYLQTIYAEHTIG